MPDFGLVTTQMGADEHQGEEMALHGTFLIHQFAVLGDAVEHKGVFTVCCLGEFLVDTAAEDIQKFLLGGGNAGGVVAIVAGIGEGDVEVVEGETKHHHLYAEFDGAGLGLGFHLQNLTLFGDVFEGGAHETEALPHPKAISRHGEVGEVLLFAASLFNEFLLRILYTGRGLALLIEGEEEQFVLVHPVPLNHQVLQHSLVAINEEVAAQGDTQ